MVPLDLLTGRKFGQSFMSFIEHETELNPSLLILTDRGEFRTLQLSLKEMFRTVKVWPKSQLCRPPTHCEE